MAPVTTRRDIGAVANQRVKRSKRSSVTTRSSVRFAVPRPIVGFIETPQTVPWMGYRLFFLPFGGPAVFVSLSANGSGCGASSVAFRAAD
jgi:hypothetical protein